MTLYSHLEQLRIINERTSMLAQRARQLADAFNGSEPQEVAGPGPKASGHTINNQFGEVIANIQDAVSALGRQLERLESQVLDGSPTTLGAVKSTRDF